MEGGNQTLLTMQNSEPGFVKRAGKAIYDEMDKAWLKKELMMINDHGS